MNLQVFVYQSKQVRTVFKDGQPWFVAKDVCDILEVSNSRDAISRLDSDEKNTVVIADGTPGNPNMTIISESGLYALIFTSRKPEAENFKRWVRKEVIPAIRKHGAYMTPETIEKVLSDPDTIIRLATELKQERQKRLELEPKAEFYDAVAGSKTAIDLGKAAKVLDMGIGRNKLFEFLREAKILMNDNVPYQKYIDQGYFRTIEQKYTKPDGSVNISIKTLVYQKGLDFIRKLYLKAVS